MTVLCVWTSGKAGSDKSKWISTNWKSITMQQQQQLTWADFGMSVRLDDGVRQTSASIWYLIKFLLFTFTLFDVEAFMTRTFAKAGQQDMEQQNLTPTNRKQRVPSLCFTSVWLLGLLCTVTLLCICSGNSGYHLIEPLILICISVSLPMHSHKRDSTCPIHIPAV